MNNHGDKWNDKKCSICKPAKKQGREEEHKTNGTNGKEQARQSSLIQPYQ